MSNQRLKSMLCHLHFALADLDFLSVYQNSLYIYIVSNCFNCFLFPPFPIK